MIFLISMMLPPSPVKDTHKHKNALFCSFVVLLLMVSMIMRITTMPFHMHYFNFESQPTLIQIHAFVSLYSVWETNGTCSFEQQDFALFSTRRWHGSSPPNQTHHHFGGLSRPSRLRNTIHLKLSLFHKFWPRLLRQFSPTKAKSFSDRQSHRVW